MAKDPKKRLRDIGDWADLLDVGQSVKSPATRLPWLWPGVAAALAFGLAALAFLEWRRSQQSDHGPVSRLTMELAPTEGLTTDLAGRPSRTAFAITPDGSTIVFSALNPGATLETGSPKLAKLYRRTLDQMESLAIPGTEGAIGPFFSPDSQWVGFWANGKLKKVSLSGGPAFTICDAPRAPFGASWSSTETIVFANGDLMQVPAKGGMPQVLKKSDPSKGEFYVTPEFLPDANTLLYTVGTSANWAEAQIVVRRLDTGEQRVLIQGGTDVRYVPTGHLLYLQNAVLMAVPFDVQRVQLAGAPVAMLDDVMQAVNEPNAASETGMGQFATSASGNLIYAAGGIYPPHIKSLLRVDRNGGETVLNAPKGVYLTPRISPDGRKLAVVKGSETSLLADIWVLDLLTGNGTRLTSQGRNWWPLWSPDGTRILFAGGPNLTQILSIAADGSGSPEAVFKNNPGTPASWSVGGKLAILRSGQILTRPIIGDGALEPFADSTSNSFSFPQFSPDGRWIAYVSTETGHTEVYVRAFPGPGEKFRISTSGGEAPVWTRDQHELYYVSYQPLGKTGMMAVNITLGASFKFGRPHQIFEGTYYPTAPLRDYDIFPDGQHFIMLRAERPPIQLVTKLTVVLNWFDELRRRVPIGK